MEPAFVENSFPRKSRHDNRCSRLGRRGVCRARWRRHRSPPGPARARPRSAGPARAGSMPGRRSQTRPRRRGRRLGGLQRSASARPWPLHCAPLARGPRLAPQYRDLLICFKVLPATGAHSTPYSAEGGGRAGDHRPGPRRTGRADGGQPACRRVLCGRPRGAMLRELRRRAARDAGELLPARRRPPDPRALRHRRGRRDPLLRRKPARGSAARRGAGPHADRRQLGAHPAVVRSRRCLLTA